MMDSCVCPRCGSLSIKTDDTETTSQEFYEERHCMSCGIEFACTYVLVKVEVYSED